MGMLVISFDIVLSLDVFNFLLVLNMNISQLLLELSLLPIERDKFIFYERLNLKYLLLSGYGYSVNVGNSFLESWWQMGKFFGCILIRDRRLSTWKNLTCRFINPSWVSAIACVIDIFRRPWIFFLFRHRPSTISSISLIRIVRILRNITVLLKTIRGCFIRSFSWPISWWLRRLNVSVLCWVQSVRTWLVCLNDFLSWKTIFWNLFLLFVTI